MQHFKSIFHFFCIDQIEASDTFDFTIFHHSTFIMLFSRFFTRPDARYAGR